MTLYSIKDLEYLSGIKAHTIRIWEKRYGLLDPNRTDTNIRSYSDDDVRKILNVALLVKNGYKISSVASFDDVKIQAEVLRINKISNDPDKSIDQLIFHTLNFDVFEFEQFVDQLITKTGLSKTMQNVVFPFFDRVGILWQTGSIFAAHEHFVSNLIRNRLIREIGRFHIQETSKTALFFLRENEMHEIGLLYSYFLAAESGLHCIYLGQSLPFADLANLLVNSKFDFVVTSFVNAIEKPELEQYLANLSLVFNRNKILISGRQIAILQPELPSNVQVVKNSNDFVRKISS
ncbi:MAG: MerR family transcriptional regulator [Prolixibacteraceae bacterium]